jgi:hypothetical protein
MSTPKERLGRLVELASQGEAARPMLAHELCDVLLDWPPDYPSAARLPFEALLEKALREVDRDTRIQIAARLARHANAPIDILNELFFAASPEMKDEIVARNASEGLLPIGGPDYVDEESLLASARGDTSEFIAAFANALGVRDTTANEILSDSSVQSLALACKGIRVGRATFSAIAVLSDRMRATEDSYSRLAVYDTVPECAAERMLAYWRTQRRETQSFDKAAE